MSTWRDDAYLLDMLIAARRAQEFTTGLSWEEFKESNLHQDAIMRVLGIVGEAARRVSPQTRDAHPEIHWQDLIGLRNRLVHEYFRIDTLRVSETVRDDIPGLIALLQPLVPPEEP